MTADIDELMHTVLDGEASVADAERLESCLREDPAMRSRFDAHRAFHERLAGVRALDPPAEIMRKVLAQAPRVVRRPSPRPMFRYAASFVIGVAAGAALLDLPGTNVDPTRVTGTLVGAPADPVPDVVAEWRGGVLVLDIKLGAQSASPTIVELRADGALVHRSALQPDG